MDRPLYFIFGLLFNISMCAKEPLVMYLEPDESVAQMAAHDDTLAIGVSYRERYDPKKSISALENSSGVALIREGVAPIRTPLKPGAMRAIVSTPSGFVAARVTYDKDSHSTVDFFEIDLKGEVTPMPSLGIDLVGLWTGTNGDVFAYGPRAVFRWSVANRVWEKLPVNPAVNADAVRRIATLKDGSSLVITDRVIKGFRSLQEPPLFVKDLQTYPKPINAFSDDHWWLMTTDGDTQKISIVSADGQIREVASLRIVNPHDVLFSGEKAFIICAREGGNIHKYSYYILNRDGTGPLGGPFMLPDDTISTCIWRDAIVSGGASDRVFKTAIEP